MNHQKKRKHQHLQEKVPTVKRFKSDLNNAEQFKKKKTISDSSKNNVTSGVNATTARKTKTQIKNGKRRKQWQSVKEKRKRLKKKYLLSKSEAEKCDSTEGKSKLINKNKESEPETMPKNSEEFSSNWKSLAKVFFFQH